MDKEYKGLKIGDKFYFPSERDNVVYVKYERIPGGKAKDILMIFRLDNREKEFKIKPEQAQHYLNFKVWQSAV